MAIKGRTNEGPVNVRKDDILVVLVMWGLYQTHQVQSLGASWNNRLAQLRKRCGSIAIANKREQSFLPSRADPCLRSEPCLSPTHSCAKCDSYCQQMGSRSFNLQGLRVKYNAVLLVTAVPKTGPSVRVYSNYYTKKLVFAH
jgi:hypothetical protein